MRKSSSDPLGSVELSEDFLRSWCDLYIACAEEHAADLSQAMDAAPKHNIADEIQNVLLLKDQDVLKKIEKLLARIAGSRELPTSLLIGHALLQQLERRASKFHGRHTQNSPARIRRGSVNYYLIPPRLEHITAAVPAAIQRKMRYRRGFEAKLGLRWKWCRLGRTNLYAYKDDSLAALRNRPLSVAICTLANARMFEWHDGPPNGSEFRPIRRGGPVTNEIDALIRERVDRALKEAAENKCAILVFPELCVSQQRLDYIQAQLRGSSSLFPFLVVAGTQHVDHGDSGKFRNRCTIVDTTGKIVTTQDKRIPFNVVLPEREHTSFEPTDYTLRIQYLETAIGRIVFAVCNDYLDDDTWGAISASLCLVPAMSPRLNTFEKRAEQFGDQGLCTVVCNADDDHSSKDRWFVYRPARGRGNGFLANGACPPGAPELWVATIDLCWDRSRWDVVAWDDEPRSPTRTAAE